MNRKEWPIKIHRENSKTGFYVTYKKKKMSVKKLSKKTGISFETCRKMLSRKDPVYALNRLIWLQEQGLNLRARPYWPKGKEFTCCVALTEEVMKYRECSRQVALIRIKKWMKNLDDDYLYRPLSMKGKKIAEKAQESKGRWGDLGLPPRKKLSDIPSPTEAEYELLGSPEQRRQSFNSLQSSNTRY